MAVIERDASEITAAEEDLWRPSTRFDVDRMEQLLHVEFIEFGRSGRVWGRADVVRVDPVEFEAELPLPDYSLEQIAPDVVLATYVSIVRFPSGVEEARRSSVWVRSGREWRLRFHQGSALD